MPQYNVDDFEGIYESLSGRKSSDRGLVATGGYVQAIATGSQVLSKNGNRVHATIRNTDFVGGADFSLMLADASGNFLDGTQLMLMRPGDVFVIDRLHPWSGAVTIYTELGITADCEFLEVSNK